MLKIYNTLTRKKEDFLPVDTPKIRMYVCGPTVYDYIHIGNARTYTIFDVTAKWLRYRGYQVNYLMNITDIEDKIMLRAQEQDQDPFAYAQKYTDIFLEDVKALKIDSVDEYPKSTDHIDTVIKQVQTLIDKGNAYTIEDDGIYFDLTTFPEYGKLANRTASMADDGVSRIDASDKKRNKGDFCLWKFSKPGEPVWDSPFGQGRPGWHIEDTAMTEHYFGPQYELHGAGIDLMFPHHEAEIAQQESASGRKPFVQYWMHGGFLTNKGTRMGKSNKNFLTLHEALDKYTPEALRFYFLSAHYRAPLEYTDANLDAAQAAVQRLGEFKFRLNQALDSLPDGDADETIRDTKYKIQDAMNDDFDTPKAYGELFELIKKLNPIIDHKELSKQSAQTSLELLNMIESIFGIIPDTKYEIPDTIQQLVDQRQVARRDKDYKKADQLRDQIIEKGYTIDDTPYGPLVKNNKD